MSDKKVSFHTLGCKLNFSETSTLAREFQNGGYLRVDSNEKSDICIINSCSVTDHADKKCRSLIRKLHRENPEAIIAVTGCYAQLKPEQLSQIEGVDLVISNNDKGRVFELVNKLPSKGKANVYACELDQLTSFFSAFSSADRTRAFLKVQDGCDYRCSYCTIPNARGKSRNISISEVITQAKKIAQEGQKEIVITGINTGDFGRSTNESFLDLLKELDKIQGIERYRISSIEPNLLTEEIISFCAQSSKFQPHFHIPIQSGCDKILGLMRRRYTTEIFRQRIALLRDYLPDAFIGIDVIVGFPGESDEDFNQTYKLLEQITPAYLHIFPYSERANTPAIHFEGKVSPQISSQRVKKLEALCHSLHSRYYESFLGKTAKVLFEGSINQGLMSGFTQHYIKFETKFKPEYVNTIREVELKSIAESGNIIGNILK